MTEDPRPKFGPPTQPAEPANPTPSWRHCHALLVLAVLTRYRIDLYKVREVHPGRVGDGIESWDDEDQTLAIEEGRRQLDSQFSQLQYVTSRASVLLPVGVAASVFFLTALGGLDEIGQPAQTIARVLLISGAALSIWGALVMGALIGDRATFKRTDTLFLADEPSGLRKYLAHDYAENVSKGENTNAARLTHLGTGVTWITLGAMLGVAGFAISAW